MKLIVLLLALGATSAFRQHEPVQRRVMSSESSMSSMSSEEDSFENVIRPKAVQEKKPQPEPIKKQFNFDRPSSDELEAYDLKVQRQGKMKTEPEPFEKKEQRKNDGKLDDAEEKAFLAVLGQMYLDKTANEVPFGAPVGPPMDPDYFFVPMDYDTPKQANNNGNNNVHVNVNHVQVNSNVLHVPGKDDRKAQAPLASRDEISPSSHYNEPISSSKYFYLNLNMMDGAILVFMLAVFLFAVKKAYTKCFPKKQLAPELPTTMPPTYSPSTITVETVPKKMVPQ